MKCRSTVERGHARPAHRQIRHGTGLDTVAHSVSPPPPHPGSPSPSVLFGTRSGEVRRDTSQRATSAAQIPRRLLRAQARPVSHAGLTKHRHGQTSAQCQALRTCLPSGSGCSPESRRRWCSRFRSSPPARSRMDGCTSGPTRTAQVIRIQAPPSRITTTPVARWYCSRAAWNSQPAPPRCCPPPRYRVESSRSQPRNRSFRVHVTCGYLSAALRYGFDHERTGSSPGENAVLPRRAG